MYDFPPEAYLAPQQEYQRPSIDDLGHAMIDMFASGEAEELEIPVEHHFTEELYGRQGVFPAGSVIVTVKHLSTHITVALRGHCTVVDEKGKKREIHAPGVWITPAGTQRSIYSHTDVEWITVHPNPEGIDDVDGMESALFENTLLPYRHLLAERTGNQKLLSTLAAKIAAPKD